MHCLSTSNEKLKAQFEYMKLFGSVYILYVPYKCFFILTTRECSAVEGGHCRGECDVHLPCGK